MKPIKQSNSMKELMKKLRRHDTLVMGAGVVAATAMCGAFVYVTTPAISANAAEAAAQQEVRKDSLGVQKKASDQLKEINSYLERLDSVVTGSQDLIKEMQTVQNNQTEITQKTLEKEKNTITGTNTTKVVEKISGLDKELESIHSEIKTTSEQVKGLEDTMTKGGSKNVDKDKESFSQITNALEDIKKSVGKSETQVSGLVTELKERKNENNADNKDANKEVLEALEKIEKDIQKADSSETLSRMQSELVITQGTYVTLLTEMEKRVNNTISDVDKSVASSSKKIESGISSVDKNVDGVSKQVDSGFAGVDQNVGEVSQKVDTGFAEVGQNVGEVSQKVDTGLAEVGQNVGEVSQKVDTGLAEVGQNVGDVSKKVESGFEGAGKNIKDVSEKVASGFSNMEEDVKDISDQVGSGMSDLGEGVEDVQENMTQGFIDIENSVGIVNDNQKTAADKLDQLGKSIGTVSGSLDNMKKQMDTISQKLNTVFDNVARGKKDMASTLATLGVSIRSDAKFSEFVEAIKKVPDAVKKSGKVKYTYHHHTNGSGAFTQDISPTQGGCYQIPVKHTHKEYCYYVKETYSYVTDEVAKIPSNNPHIEVYHCSYCNKDFNRATHSETTDDKFTAEIRAMGGYYMKKETRSLVCGRSTDSIDGYTRNCGFAENAIEKAEITYSGNYKANMLSASKVSKYYDGEILCNELIIFDQQAYDSQDNGEYEEDACCVEETSENAGETTENEALNDEKEAEDNSATPDVTSESGEQAQGEKTDNSDQADTSLPDDGQANNEETVGNIKENDSGSEAEDKKDETSNNDSATSSADNNENSSNNSVTESSSDKKTVEGNTDIATESTSSETENHVNDCGEGKTDNSPQNSSNGTYIDNRNEESGGSEKTETESGEGMSATEESAENTEAPLP